MKKINMSLIIWLIMFYTLTQALNPQSSSKSHKNTSDQITGLNNKNDSTQFVLVEGGEFTINSNNISLDRTQSQKVVISSFFISRFEITQAEWQSIMIGNPSLTKGDKYPVNQISWYQAIVYCNKRSQKEGLTPCYAKDGITNPDYWGKIPRKYSSNQIEWDKITCNWESSGYRLPTEVEWEFAALGGKYSKGYIYSGSDNIDEVAWYIGNSGDKVHEVGTKSPNELGIYDISGNVTEMCWDWYKEYRENDQIKSQRIDNSFGRVIRGGNFGNKDQSCTNIHRSYIEPYFAGYLYGFRIVRSLSK